MTLEMFSIKDGAVAAYAQPFFARSRAEAVRILQDTMASGDHQFARHPADFELFHMGTFDDQTGLVTTNDTPEHVIQLLDLSTSE